MHCLTSKDCAAKQSCKLAFYCETKVGGVIGEPDKGVNCKEYKYLPIKRSAQTVTNNHQLIIAEKN